MEVLLFVLIVLVFRDFYHEIACGGLFVKRSTFPAGECLLWASEMVWLDNFGVPVS